MKHYLAGTREGNAKEERNEGENTNTNTPGPERANPEKPRERKADGRQAKNRPDPDTTYKARAKPT